MNNDPSLPLPPSLKAEAFASKGMAPKVRLFQSKTLLLQLAVLLNPKLSQ